MFNVVLLLLICTVKVEIGERKRQREAAVQARNASRNTLYSPNLEPRYYYIVATIHFDSLCNLCVHEMQMTFTIISHNFVGNQIVLLGGPVFVG
jgi:hypothetical protein